MSLNNLTTEQLLVQSAEYEFLENGYAATKLSTIAKNVNVNHAMIHYYFRTKEKIFNIVFKNKIELLANEFEKSFASDLAFFDQLEIAIDAHISFLERNPKLLFFICKESHMDLERMQMLRNSIQPRLEAALTNLEQKMAVEISKGIIKQTTAADLFMNIIALDVTIVFTPSLLEETNEKTDICPSLSEDKRQEIKKYIIDGVRK